MPGPKYPLDPLLRLRENQVDQAQKELAGAVKERESAAARRERAERELAAERERQKSVRDAERAALEQGALTAADLARAGAWELAARAEEDALAKDAVKKAGEEGDAIVREAEERANVARREADARVIDEDKTRFEERLRKQREAKEQEAAEEAWRRKE